MLLDYLSKVVSACGPGLIVGLGLGGLLNMLGPLSL